MFRNELVDARALPRIPLESFSSLPPAYLKKRVVVAAILAGAEMLVVGVLWLVPALRIEVPLDVRLRVTSALVLAGGWGAIVAFRGYARMSYLVREHDITFRRGWLVRSQVTVPKSRIQHAEVQRGPLDRKMGLSALKLYTAGSSGSNLSIPGLPAETADALRDALIASADGN